MDQDKEKATAPMPGVAIGFIALTAIGGALALHQGFLQWHSRNWLQFVVYGLMALLTSVWKVALPGIHGTIPANFIYVLLGILDLSLGEILVTGCSSVLFQCVWKAKTKHTFSQVLFNVTSTASSIYVAHAVFYSSVGAWIGLKEPILICVAACVYFVTNTGAIAVITGLTEQKNIARIWRRCYFWSFPYYLVGAGCAEGIQIMNRLLGWQSTVVIPPILYFIFRLYSLYLSRLEKEKEHAEIQRKHAEEMASLHLRTIEALALAIEAKDQTTHDHLRRVQVYCLEIAREIGLPGPQRDALLAASLLHDIGKLAVPEHIISKPGRLTAEEFEKIKIHPIVGAEILERVEFPYPVAPIVRGHHEKWDGSGYPDGLNGEDIPIGARILSVVDCLDALASDRQYRRALPLDEAMAIVAAESGKSYEPRIVDILKRNYHDWEAKARDSKPVWFRLSTDIGVEGVAPTGGFEQSLPQGKPRPEARPPVEFFNRIAEARQEAQTLYEVAQDLVNSLSLHDTLSVMAMRLKRLVPHDSIAVFIRRDDEVVCEFANGDDARLFATLRIPLGQGLSGWVVENQTPILNGNPSVELGYLKDQTKFSVMRSTLAVPLQSASGVVGALALYSSQRDAFSKDHLRIMQAVSSKLAQSIENSLRLQRAEGDATTDFLTGLPNARSLFLHLQQLLDKAREIQRSVAILVCDLDGFKVVNDNHGHLTGNRLLQAVAGAILRGCRSGDYAARMGGDEFVIILPEATHAEAIVIADRFRATVEDTSRELGVADVSMSIGVSEYPAHGKEPEELLAEADRRMYLDKQARKRNMHATLSRLLEAIDDEATVKT